MESVRTALVAEVADAELAPPARQRGNKKYNRKKQRMQAQDKSKTHQLKLNAAMLKLLCAHLGLEPTPDAADHERGNYYGLQSADVEHGHGVHTDSMQGLHEMTAVMRISNETDARPFIVSAEGTQFETHTQMMKHNLEELKLAGSVSLLVFRRGFNARRAHGVGAGKGERVSVQRGYMHAGAGTGRTLGDAINKKLPAFSSTVVDSASRVYGTFTLH